MKRKTTPRQDALAAQIRRIRWQHGLTPRLARAIAELHYGGAAQ